MGNPYLYRVAPTGLRLTRRAALASGLAAVFGGHSWAQVEPGSPGDTLDEITARGTIRIGVYDDFEPYSYLANGRPTGTDVDVAHLIAEALGVKAEIELRRADENIDADLRSHVWRGPVAEPGNVVNVMLHMPIDRELTLRNDMVAMGGAYASEKTVLAWSKSQLGDIPTMADFTENKIAVENDSIADFYLSGFAGGGIAKNIIHKTSMAEAAIQLVDGEVAGVMGPMAQIEYALAPLGEQRNRFGVATTIPAGLSQGQWAYGFAVRTNYRDLYYAVEQALADAARDGRVRKIFESRKLTYNPPPPPREE